MLFQATPLPYESGSIRIEGSGEFGSVDGTGTLVNFDDVDLLRVEVAANTRISVNVELNIGDPGVVRFFDSAGNELNSDPGGQPGTQSLTVANDGIIYIGLSGRGNDAYDPRAAGSGSPGQPGPYTASIDISTPLVVLSEGNLIEVTGISRFTSTPSSLFSFVGPPSTTAIPIPASRFDTADEVAASVRQVLADRFTGGNIDVLSTDGNVIGLGNLFVGDAGPFVEGSSRYADGLGDPADTPSRARTAASDNVHEGVYLDDFIIGFAERGELGDGVQCRPRSVCGRRPATVPGPR